MGKHFLGVFSHFRIVIYVDCSPVLDPVGKVLRLVEEVLAEGVVGDELDVTALVQLAAPVVLFAKHHTDAQVLDGPDHVLIGEQ